MILVGARLPNAPKTTVSPLESAPDNAKPQIFSRALHQPRDLFAYFTIRVAVVVWLCVPEVAVTVRT